MPDPRVPEAAGRRTGLDTDRPAGLVSRGVAAVVDLAVVLAVLGVAYLGAALIQLMLSVHRFHWPQTDPFFTLTAFVVVCVGYPAVCWALSGRTVGAAVMGLRVVSRRGRAVSFPLALLRAAICVFFAVGLLWVAVDRRRRSVADVLVRTRVVYSHREPTRR